MRRRALLSSAAGLLSTGLAGCLDQSDSDPTTPGPSGPTTEQTTRSPTTSRTTQFDASLDVEPERHQNGVAVMGIDSVGVRESGHQYVFYRVAVTDGDPPERADFGFRYGGNVLSPGVDSGGQLWRAFNTDDRYAGDRGEGWLVFELPDVRDAERAAFTLGNEEWPVPDWIGARLSAPEPMLSVDWGLSDDQPEDAARLTFKVTNESDADTRFVAGLNAIEIRVAYRPVEAFAREVPAGETVSWTVTHDTGKQLTTAGEDDQTGRFQLDWVQGDSYLEVKAADAE
jgi:hypothetical protein